MLSDLVSLQRDGGQALLHLSASYHVLGFQDADCQTKVTAGLLVCSMLRSLLQALLMQNGTINMALSHCLFISIPCVPLERFPV